MEEKLFNLEQAINRMTVLPAEKFSIVDRGRIQKGMKADLVMLNPETVMDTATYDDPHQYPEGILKVMVNGSWVVDAGVFTDKRPGKVLLRC